VVVYTAFICENYVNVLVDDPILHSSVFMEIQKYFSEVFMSHTVLLLNILELNDVVTSKVFIYIVAVLKGRHTPELFKKLH